MGGSGRREGQEETELDGLAGEWMAREGDGTEIQLLGHIQGPVGRLCGLDLAKRFPQFCTR